MNTMEQGTSTDEHFVSGAGNTRIENLNRASHAVAGLLSLLRDEDPKYHKRARIMYDATVVGLIHKYPGVFSLSSELEKSESGKLETHSALDRDTHGLPIHGVWFNDHIQETEVILMTEEGVSRSVPLSKFQGELTVKVYDDSEFYTSRPNMTPWQDLPAIAQDYLLDELWSASEEEADKLS